MILGLLVPEALSRERGRLTEGEELHLCSYREVASHAGSTFQRCGYSVGQAIQLISSDLTLVESYFSLFLEPSKEEALACDSPGKEFPLILGQSNAVLTEE